MTDETTDSFKITWTQAPGRVLRYRIIYRPVTGGESKEVTTPANQRRRTLENLTPDTKYEVSVIPEYFSGPGTPLTGNAATEEGRANAHRLVITEILDCRRSFGQFSRYYEPQNALSQFSECLRW